MISRKNRFHGHNSVNRVRGKSIHSENFSYKSASNSRSDYRLAVVVSKKIDNRAVVRNRIRRRVFEAVRKEELLKDKAIDSVIYIKSVAVKDMPSSEITKELSKLISRSATKKPANPQKRKYA